MTSTEAAAIAEDELRFHHELRALINRHSRENGSNTPDFILAEYLADCLAAYDKAVTRRAEWRTPAQERPLSALERADEAILHATVEHRR